MHGSAASSAARICTATMAGEAEGSGTEYFVDTSVIVAATVEVHPSHETAAEFVDNLIASGAELHISPQVCREFLVVLTRQPVSGRVFTVDEAIAALAVWRAGCNLLGEDEVSVNECLELTKRFGVQGKQVHDCNIVATMKAHGLRKLLTRNPRDFERYRGEIDVTPIPAALA